MNDNEMLRETYRLAQENNKLLHKMRRTAFWHGLITFIVYAALIVAPVWFYSQYLSPVVDQMFKAVQQVQGTGAQASAQFNSLQQAWQQLQDRFKSTGTSSTQ
jgi:predicted PurR-regulated permease PerM